MISTLLNARRIAVVGVAKNCGKTTTLNHLILLAGGQGKTLGLMSVGIDGESEDVLLGTAKPPIHVTTGQWVVTAEDAAHASTASLEYFETLGFDTPLGEVVVAKVVGDGEIILAGLRHRADMRNAIGRLESQKVDLILIDGAYGRVTAAHADLTDGVVVSTGAIVSPHIEVIIERTRHLIDRLTLPEIEEPWLMRLLDKSVEEGRSLLGGPTIAAIPLAANSALVGLPHSRGLWTDDVKAIAIPGVVSDRVVDELLRAGGAGRTLVIGDGTNLQADHRHLERLRRTWTLQVPHSTRVLGIAVNPTSVQGWVVSEAELLARLRTQWPEITIYNPDHGLVSTSMS